jgi:hypothetical protein
MNRQTERHASGCRLQHARRARGANDVATAQIGAVFVRGRSEGAVLNSSPSLHSVNMPHTRRAETARLEPLVHLADNKVDKLVKL